MKNTEAREKAVELREVVREVLEAKHQQHLLKSGAGSLNNAQFEKLKARRGSMSAIDTYKQMETKLEEARTAAQSQAAGVRSRLSQLLDSNPALHAFARRQSAGSNILSLSAEQMQVLAAKVKASEGDLKAEIDTHLKTKEGLLLEEAERGAKCAEIGDLKQRTALLKAKAAALEQEMADAQHESRRLGEQLRSHDGVQRSIHEQLQAREDSAADRNREALQPADDLLDNMSPTSILQFYAELVAP